MWHQLRQSAVRSLTQMTSPSRSPSFLPSSLCSALLTPPHCGRTHTSYVVRHFPRVDGCGGGDGGGDGERSSSNWSWSITFTSAGENPLRKLSLKLRGVTARPLEISRFITEMRRCVTYSAYTLHSRGRQRARARAAWDATCETGLTGDGVPTDRSFVRSLGQSE